MSEKGKKQRQQEAIGRLEARQTRSDAEQLAYLVSRGHGHCKEAVRLRGAK